MEVYKVKIARLSSPQVPPSPWQFVLVQLPFSINFFALVLSPHPSPEGLFLQLSVSDGGKLLPLYGKGESVVQCLWQWSSDLPCVTPYRRWWFSGSGVLLWYLHFIKSSQGESDEPIGLRIIYLVSNTAVINCTRDVCLRIILWESNEIVSLMETCLT